MSITEHELKERAVAPRVTFEQVKDSIHSEFYFTAGQGTRDRAISIKQDEALSCLTFCVLILKNGFTITGQSACADPANYKKDIGERIAYDNAVSQIWPLLGYELRTKLALLDKGTTPSFPDMMKTYIGTKVIHAWPMSRFEYNTLRGWQIPINEDPLDEGFLVEYVDGGRANVEHFTGYVSWSPKDVFEAAYKVVG